MAPQLPETVAGWPENPIARVILDSSVPHLDRRFDYLVPPELDEKAQPGVRVKAVFGHQTMTGWLAERRAEAATGAKLMPLKSVVSLVPVLAPQVLDVAEATAARYAGTVADVLRNVVPARVARVEKEFTDAAADPGPAPEIHAPETTVLDDGHVPGLSAALETVGSGGEQRLALTLPSAHGAWDAMDLLAELAQRTAALQKGAIIVVPDVRSLDRLCRTLDARVGEHGYARLSANDGPTPRYREFLRIKTGQRRIVVGTRAAAWAPVHELGLIIVWDDADELHTEPRAPYFHVRDVALLRAAQQDCTVLLTSTTRSVEAQRMVEADYITELEVPRDIRHRVGPRVISTADSFNMARDPLATRARLPHLAWTAAREALHGERSVAGPVLVQVGRAGFIPGLMCQSCGTPARCRHCAGPLSYADRYAAGRGETSCRWCGRHERHFQCLECGGQRLRAGSRGVDRTADELGRAFPQIPVLSSSADHMLSTISDEPALVVATNGSEPVAEGGYAAALLLDGDPQLQREGLRVPEVVLGHWMRAATLVRPAADGGIVVVTASRQDVVGALVLMNPVTFASRELAERRTLGLPPTVRSAEVTGSRSAVTHFIGVVELPYRAESSPWIGPTPVTDTTEDAAAPGADRYRALLFFPYAVADQVTAALRAARVATSARRRTGSVRVRVDPADVL